MSVVRLPKTTNERRATSVHQADDTLEGVKIRLARQGANMPNSWDDKQSPAYRSWKKHRKNQWK